MSRQDIAFVEEFAVGQRRRGEPRTVTREDIVACAAACGTHGDDPEGVATSAAAQQLLGAQLCAAQLGELGLARSDTGWPNTTTWTVRRPLSVADTIRLETAVTRCQRGHDEPAGLVNLHARLVDADREVRHEGVVSTQLPARPGSDPPPPDRDFGSPAWAAVLAERLRTERAFADATHTFDGSIELQAGLERCQLRVYRGEILETGRSTPAGPTFTLAGAELAWLELAEAPRNDYIRHAMQGDFQARGNTHEYLRLTKAVVTLWDAIRDLAGLARGVSP